MAGGAGCSLIPKKGGAHITGVFLTVVTISLVALLLVEPSSSARDPHISPDRAASVQAGKYILGKIRGIIDKSDTMSASTKPVPPGPVWKGKRYEVWESIKYTLPFTYLVPHIDPSVPPPLLNGEPTTESWNGAEWTKPFMDIEGSPPRLPPRFETKVKMMWQKEKKDRPGGLWIGVIMEEPLLMGTLHTDNLPVFKYDHDFEVFINCDGSTHKYFEFEMNARNVTWQLSLPKPYSEGGNPISPDECPGLKSSVFLKGKLDDPSAENKGWSIVMFVPFKGMHTITGQPEALVKANDFWRLTFSRVELPVHVVDNKIIRNTTSDGKEQAEDNWTWSPQGIVDMHLPQRWSFVHFSESITGGPLPYEHAPPDPFWKEREFLTRLFLYQHDYQEYYGHYAEEANSLIDDEPELTGRTKIVPNETYWIAVLPLKHTDEMKWMSINFEGLTLVHKNDPLKEDQQLV